MLGEIIQYWTQHKKEIRKMNSFEQKTLFTELIYTAFGYIPKSCGTDMIARADFVLELLSAGVPLNVPLNRLPSISGYGAPAASAPLPSPLCPPLLAQFIELGLVSVRHRPDLHPPALLLPPRPRRV